MMNLNGFAYQDLYEPSRLPQLDHHFDDYLRGRDLPLARAFAAYRAGQDLAAPQMSELLIRVAQKVEEFLVAAFGVRADQDALRDRERQLDPLHAFKEQFVKPRARRPRVGSTSQFQVLDEAVTTLLGDDRGAREQAVARLWARASGSGDADVLALLDEWVCAACHTVAGRSATRGWHTLQVPGRPDYFQLVPVEPLADDAALRFTGRADRQRRRDGFNLTDVRGDLPLVMHDVHYCVYCHTRQSDFCSKGFPEKETKQFKINPLGVTLSGCPLGEKISEAHALKRDGFTLGALAVIMIDNPLLPATGHRICNDCMKSCIYQKQDPVNVPQIETRILTDVLGWRWGFEIYFLLTRWNPLNRERPYTEPYHGHRVLCAGIGPAGFNLSYHLLQAGFGVVAIDGLKIEPLPSRWVGSPSSPPAPVESVTDLYEPLNERTNAGFGGVAEYGITARWDKNFLRLIQIVLARYRTFSAHGGVRVGGTLTLDDAWNMGFDHVALATGAGRPSVIDMKHNLAHGVRQASDFLMALQLTGAAKWDSLANLQIRLPALVIGGGLTAIDTATEAQAYYIRQVEKLAQRYEAMGAAAAAELEASLTEPEHAIFKEYLGHAAAVAQERARAEAAGEAPDFAPLLHAWGGVTVVYRRALHESPAYVRNHEEIEKALQEGIYYAEGLIPFETCLDQHGHAASVRFHRQVRGADGRWHEGDEVVVLTARSVFIAAGSVPNTVYEREHPGTFEMNGAYFASHAAMIDENGIHLVPVPAAAGPKDPTIGFFTSYQKGSRLVSFHGDTHPQFHGSVVKAMASGRQGAAAIEALFAGRIAAARKALRDGAQTWQRFVHALSQDLEVRVTRVEPLGPVLTRLTLKAPQAVRNWRPGHVYRLQNYESNALVVAGTKLQMEGIAIDGTQADAERGEITLLLNAVGASTRIASMLQPGERVVLMGPSGTATPMPINQAVTVIGNHSAVTSLLDGALHWRARGNQVRFVGHFPDAALARPVRPLVREVADEVIWVFDSGPNLECDGVSEHSVTGGLERFLSECAAGPHAAWIQDADQLLVSDRPLAMQALAQALKTSLSARLKPGLVATAAVNSPMQCMMKEVCAQCLCRHRDRSNNVTRIVFSCFNHHQPLFDVDFGNLKARQGQNSVQEKVTAAWLRFLLDRASPDRTAAAAS